MSLGPTFNVAMPKKRKGKGRGGREGRKMGKKIDQQSFYMSTNGEQWIVQLCLPLLLRNPIVLVECIFDSENN